MDALLLIKHAMPEIVADAPPARWVLGEDGRAGANELTPLVARYSPKHMFSSTEPKARETGAIMTHALGIPCEQRLGLHEHQRPNERWMGRDAFHAIIARFFERPDALVYGSETADEASVRFGSAMDLLLADHPTGSIAVTAHGTVISLYVAERTGENPFSLWQRLGLPSFVALSRSDLRLIEVVESVGPTG